MTTEQPKLKPCPFCGGEKTKTEQYPYYSVMDSKDCFYSFISCCACFANGGGKETYEEAVEHWNRRASAAD